MLKLCTRGVRVGLAVVLAQGLAAASGVTVLNKPQLGLFTTIQAAVDASSDDDVLLVQTGTYAGFTIDNKSLSVLATGAAGNVTISGTTRIQNLAASRSVSLVGLTIVAVDSNLSSLNIVGLELTSDVGNVRLQGCLFKGARYAQYGGSIYTGGHGVLVAASTKVIFTQCTLIGRDIGFNSGNQPSAGGDALRMTDSVVALFDCSLKGGRGSDETYPLGGKGGAACRVTNYGVFVSGSTLTAGNGGGGDYIGCTGGGRGGDALVINDAQAQLLGATLTAGSGNGFYTCTPGVDGQQIISNNGVVNVLAGTRRKLTAPAITNDNSILPFVFSGEPGDNVWLLFGKKPAFLFVAGFNGVVAIPSPWFTSMLPAGVIDATGTLNFNYVIGDLQSPSEGWMWNVQGFIRGPAGSFVTSPLRILIRNT